MNNLASVLLEQDPKSVKARELLRKSAQLMKDDNPEKCTVMQNLGILLLEDGQEREAEGVLLSALSFWLF
jgi:Flp pilus assembly protein TadD